jgi:hypothetical protein
MTTVAPYKSDCTSARDKHPIVITPAFIQTPVRRYAILSLTGRFLFNRIDTKAAAPAISRQHHSIPCALPNKTKSALALIELAKSRTEPALDAPIRQHHPPATGKIGLCQRRDHGL